jgi:hypothetical protein
MTISAPGLAVPGIALALALAACGGSAGHPAAAATTQAATTQACQQIGAAPQAVAAASKQVNASCPGAAS